MTFTSFPFLLFAGLTVLLYHLLPGRGKWILLLIASLAFYALGGVWYLPFLLLTILSTFGAALLISRHAKRSEAEIAARRDSLTKGERKALKAAGKRVRFRILAAGLILNFGLLAVLKYTAFAVTTINGVTGLFDAPALQIPSLLLPLGISFYTFRSTAYLIDVYRGTVEAETNPAKYALFISFFPAIVQGPICRMKDLGPQLFTPHKAAWEDMSAGSLRLLWGFFKKVVIADTAMIAVKAIVGKPEEYQGMYVFLLILLYSAVIYGDFTGGMDISIGLSRMMGIRLTENFLHPFSSKSTQEYWNRWHVTMGSYFTDYVFYPLSISTGMQKLSKWSRAHLGKGVGMRLPVYLATLITWFLTGLWHGASWNFIVWGLLNGAVVLISRECQPLYARFHKTFPGASDNAVYGAFCCVRTFLLMGAIRILDCYRDVPLTFRAFGSIFIRPGTWVELWNGQALEKLGLSLPTWLMLGAATLIVFFVSRAGKAKPVADRVSARPAVWGLLCTALILAVLLFGSYGIGFDASDFIYGQF